ncbi:hypothetical protein D3C77_579090 [compost metagenome]
MDVLVQQKTSNIQYPSHGRPYLTAMALRQSRTVLCFSITMEAPSFRYPLKELTFLQHAPNLFQGFNLVIHADRGMFSRDLVDKYFGTAAFMPIAPTSLDNRFLERTLLRVIHATSGHLSYDDIDMIACHHAEPLITTTQGDLASFLFDFWQKAHNKINCGPINKDHDMG